VAELTAAEEAELRWSNRRVPTVTEALTRAEPGVTYSCADGWTITFGKSLVKFPTPELERALKPYGIEMPR
jgi:hypothetical protein